MNILSILFGAMLIMSSAWAGPGAHGPNGEHLDGPAATAQGASVPTVETYTESFELLGRLSGGELSILIDRYETNEPVLGGELEVQYKNLKTKAKFHADLGDYAVDDPTFLAAISKPGSHALLFTLVAGEESDLLEGTLQVSVAAEHAHPDAGARRWLIAAIAASLVIAALAVALGRRRFGQGKGA